MLKTVRIRVGTLIANAVSQPGFIEALFQAVKFLYVPGDLGSSASWLCPALK